MIYKSPAPSLTHEITCARACQEPITFKKKAYLPTIFYLAMLPQTQIFFRPYIGCPQTVQYTVQPVFMGHYMTTSDHRVSYRRSVP